MKSLIVLVIYISISYGFQDYCQGAYLRIIIEMCLMIHGGDRAHIYDIKHFKKSRNEDGKFIRACILTECNYFGEDGKFTADVPTRVAWILHGGDETKVNAIGKATADCVALQKYNDTVYNISETFFGCIVERSTVALKLYGVFD